jgi:phosphoglycerol transferase
MFSSEKAGYRLVRSFAPISYGLALSLGGAGFGSVQFGKPFHLSGDHLFFLNWVANFSHNNDLYSNPSLGFPEAQNYILFPDFDLSYKAIIYLATRLTSNVFLAADLFYIIGISLIFLACFLSLRLLTVGPWLAATAAAAYIVTPYFATRALGHDFLSLYYGVPIAATVPLLFLQQHNHDVWRSAPVWFSLLAVVLAGTSGVYYGFYSAMFIMLAAQAASVVSRRAGYLLYGLLFACSVLGIFAISGYGPHLLAVMQRTTPQPVRFPIEQITYGLAIGNMFEVIPGFPMAREYLRAYHTVLPVSFSLPEWPGLLLTCSILCAPVLLTASAFISGAASERPRLRRVFLAAALIVFGMLFATSGGFGFMFNLLISPLVRAHARIMPFLQFYALVILCLGAEELSVHRHRLGAASRVVLAIALILSAMPSAGVLHRVQSAFLSSSSMVDNVPSVLRVLAAKDASGITAVLQLPYLSWPEVPPQLTFDPYQHQLPFVFDRVDSRTRWSYGLSALQPSFKVVADQIAPNGNYAGLAARARTLGFDGLLIEKAAYSPEQLADMVVAVEKSLATSCKLVDDAKRLFYALANAPDGSACGVP